MSTSTKIDSTPARMAIEPARARQTERPRTPFRDVLANGVGLLMSGAETATRVVGGPVFAAAVHEAGAALVGRIGETGAGSTAGGGGPSPGVGGPLDATSAYALQRESQAMNLQLLALQEQIQNENRRFTTMTNVLRAQHDTAKAEVANIRS